MESEKSNIHNLSDEHIRILTFLAFSIRSMSCELLKEYYTKMFKKNLGAMRSILNDLVNEGYVQHNKARFYWQSETFEIKNEWIYEAMRLLLTESSNYFMKFNKVFTTRDPDYLLRMNYCLIYKSIFDKEKSKVKLSENDISRLNSFFYCGFKDHPEILQFLPSDLFQYMTARYAFKLINDDSGDGIGKLIDILRESEEFSQLPKHLLHLLQLGYVMQTGYRHDGILMKGSSCYSQLVEMVEAMEKKDFEVAVGAFLKAVGSPASDKKTYRLLPQQFPLLDMLYGMAKYMVRRENRGNGLTREIFSDLNVGQSEWLLPVRVFADAVGSDLSPRTVEGIGNLIDHAPISGWVNQKLGMMLSEWQGITQEQIVKQGCEETLCDPKTIEYHAHATRLAKDLLMTIPVKQQWERALDMIMTKEGGHNGRSKVTDDKEKTSRLAYFMTESKHIEVREQSRLKSGRWSSGKKVSISHFYYMNDSFMDDVDVRIQDRLKSYRYIDVLSLGDILPLLKGSRKLYYGNCAPYANCDIVEGKPFITTHVGDDGIKITTNLPQKELSDQDETHLIAEFTPNKSKRANDSDPDGIVTYYQVPVRLRQYIKALVAIGKFPLDAEPQLKQVFEQIKGLVEIHSEMIEGGSTLPKVDGKSNVIIRIVPVGGKYDVQAVVRPLENGWQTVLPGRGDSNVYDQGPDNVRYHVIRDKKQEKQNAKALCDFMETADVQEVSPYVWSLDPYSLLELMEWLPEQGNDYVTEWPEGEKLKLRTPDVSKWNISLKERAGWFDVEGELPIDENTVLGIGQLLELMGEGRGRFIKLENGEYLRLTESLRRQLQRIDSVANNVRGKMKISALGAGLIADYLDGDVEINHPKKIDDLRKRIKKSEDMQVEIPDELNATLRDYQTDGVQWINRLTSWGAGACLADDMGLGKTVQSITFLLQKQMDGASMVVAPASVVPNWKKELVRFAPTLNVSVLNDLSSDDRKTAIQEAKAGDIILTTYGLLISEEESLVEKEWNVVCLDEAHNIKNASTKTSAVCMRLQAVNRLILTGTPIQNHLGELWNLFCFINPGLLGSYEQFTKKYINPIEGAHDKERQQQLRRIIQPFMLRRTKKEVVRELPDKQEITIPVELSKEELAIYELIRMEAKAQLEEDAGGNGAASINALAMITKLRMASCSATLVQKKWSGVPSKLSTFSDLVSEICTAGNRVLVFSQFTSFLEMARQQLESLGIKDYLYLDGSTPISKRTKMVEQFQAGKSQLFFISLKAGGLGLNLTGANYVIHLDPWWNPAIEQQATDRAYRIGQKQNVTVYHLISEHTIEEKIVRLHQTKRDLADSLLDGTDMSHKLSARDLLDMLQTDII